MCGIGYLKINPQSAIRNLYSSGVDSAIQLVALRSLILSISNPNWDESVFITKKCLRPRSNAAVMLESGIPMDRKPGSIKKVTYCPAFNRAITSPSKRTCIEKPSPNIRFFRITVTSATSAEYPWEGKNSVFPLVQETKINISMIKTEYLFISASTNL